MQKTHIDPHWPRSSVISHSSKYNAATSASFWGSGSHMRNLRRLRRYLTFDSAKLLEHALVSNRLDYCNSLLFGVAYKEIVQLQRIQNSLARVVTKKPPLTRSVPLLYAPFTGCKYNFSIEFETCLLTYRTFNENQPDCAMLTPSVPSRSLRSNNGNNFSVPKVKTNTGARAFALAAPLCGIGSLPLSGQPLQQHLSRDV